MARPTHPSDHPAILMLEDDPDIRALVAELLADAGYRPVPAPTYPEALAFIAACRLDLILADPPGPDREALAPLLAAAGDTPVVLCTARDPAALADWAARGFADVLPKPFDLAELLAVVACHCPPPRRA